MCKSVRYNLNYNLSKVKDKLVVDYLERISSSETDEIKSILYKIASRQFVLVPNDFTQNKHIITQNLINTNCADLTQNELIHTELHENDDSSDDDSVSKCIDLAQEEVGSAIMNFF